MSEWSEKHPKLAAAVEKYRQTNERWETSALIEGIIKRGQEGLPISDEDIKAANILTGELNAAHDELIKAFEEDSHANPTPPEG